MSDDNGWETVPKANQRRRGNQRRRARKNPNSSAWSSPPLTVEYIPPTPSNENFEQCLVLLVGLPGSGKSTFSRALEQAMPYKFVRINQDELKTRRECEARAKEVLSEGKSVIIDRCNFDANQRQTWYDLASNQHNGLPIICICLYVPMEECVRRCESRLNHETIRSEDARRVVGIVQRQLQFPTTRNETSLFRSMWTIHDSNAFNDAILALLNQ